MKNFIVLIVLLTGLLFSSCKKEDNMIEENPVTTFEDFQEWSGDKLVYSEELSDDEFDVFIYYNEDESIEPLRIAQPKKNNDKGIYPRIECDKAIHCWGDGVVTCETPFDECSTISGNGLQICDWVKLMTCFTQ